MVTPEVESRLAEFETSINARLTEFENRLSTRLTEVENRLSERIDAGFAELLADNQEINRRLDRVFYIWLGMGGVLLVNLAVTLSLRFL